MARKVSPEYLAERASHFYVPSRVWWVAGLILFAAIVFGIITSLMSEPVLETGAPAPGWQPSIAPSQRAQPTRHSGTTPGRMGPPTPTRPSPASLQQQGQTRCWSCGGTGTVHCDFCQNGRVRCDFCQNGYVACDFCNNGVVQCDFCGGRGGSCVICGGKGYYTCPICGGKGYYICPICGGKQYYTCPICGGKTTYQCPFCHGTGVSH